MNFLRYINTIAVKYDIKEEIAFHNSYEPRPARDHLVS